MKPKIKPGSHADKARMKSRYPNAAKTAQDALREQIRQWLRVIHRQPAKNQA